MTSPILDKEDEDWVDGASAAGYDFVRFTMSDIHGIARSKLIPRCHVDEKLKTGVSLCSRKLRLDCSSIRKTDYVSVNKPMFRNCVCFSAHRFLPERDYVTLRYMLSQICLSYVTQRFYI